MIEKLKMGVLFFFRFVICVSLLYMVNSLLFLFHYGTGIGINYVTLAVSAVLGIPGILFSYAVFLL